MDPRAVARLAADVGVDTTGDGAHHPLATEAARSRV
jgi:hypothetical protein